MTADDLIREMQERNPRLTAHAVHLTQAGFRQLVREVFRHGHAAGEREASAAIRFLETITGGK